MNIDLSSLPARRAHDLLISGIIPRPIAWVSSVSIDGKVNLAPFSMFNAVTWSPPTLCFSVVNRPDGTYKDTYVNIKATRNFVVNMVSADLADKMVATSAILPEGAEKAKVSGLELISSTYIKAPRIAEARVAYECELNRIVTIGSGANAGNLIIGTIKTMVVRDDILSSTGEVDWEKLQPVARLGGSLYSDISSTFELNM